MFSGVTKSFAAAPSAILRACLRHSVAISRLRLRTPAAREPFLVSAVYHDDAFTYIKCAAREKPTLYELKDGKPNLINFQLDNGVYIVPKIIDTGYLTIGKKKLTFSRRG